MLDTSIPRSSISSARPAWLTPILFPPENVRICLPERHTGAAMPIELAFKFITHELHYALFFALIYRTTSRYRI